MEEQKKSEVQKGQLGLRIYDTISGTVAIEFGAPLSWCEMTAQEARRIGNALRLHADKAFKTKRSIERQGKRLEVV